MPEKKTKQKQQARRITKQNETKLLLWTRLRIKMESSLSGTSKILFELSRLKKSGSLKDDHQAKMKELALRDDAVFNA